MSNRIYPIGIQNFEKIRVDGYFYVDKTALIYQMVKTGGYYFLSRPRRFGKSLLISTLEAYFSGKKELFEGLAMEKLEKDWIKYPVIHLDLNAKKFDTVDDLIRLVDRQLLVYESQYGSCSKDETIDDRLVTLIRLAAEKTGQRVVMVSLRIAAFSSARVISSPSRYFSMSSSSFSATVSTRMLRYSSACSRISSGIGSVRISLPISS